MMASKCQKAIMVMSGGTEAPLIFGDLSKDERVIYLTKPLNELGKVSTFLRRLHLATKINKYVQLPFRGIWDDTLALSHIKLESYVDYHIIFINTSIVKYRLEYLKILQKKYNIKYYLYMVDSVSTEKGREVKAYLEDIKLFKRIYSFDQGDCKEYGFYPMIQPLTKFENTDCIEAESVADLYFLGRAKGRLPLLSELSKRFKDEVKLNFKIISDDEKEITFLNENGWFSNYVSYQQNISYVYGANVLLELLQENQQGNTLRYQEAIMYNKKLLTNNQNALYLPFYDPNFIKVFKTVDDIELDWLTRQEKVSYGYNNEFSAKKLIDLIFDDIDE